MRVNGDDGKVYFTAGKVDGNVQVELCVYTYEHLRIRVSVQTIMMRIKLDSDIMETCWKT